MFASPPTLSGSTGRWLWLIPKISFTMFVATVLGLLWLSQKADREEQRQTLISDMLWLEQTLRFQMTHNEGLLGQVGTDPKTSRASFKSLAQALIRNQTGLRRILWLGAKGERRAEFPTQTAAPIDAQSLTLAHSLGRPIYGNAYRASQGGWRFDVYVPHFDDGKITGVIVGVYSMQRVLDESIPWWLAERYRVVVTDSEGKLLASRSKVEAPYADEGYQLAFDPPGRGLSLRATPYRASLPLAGRLLSSALVFLALVVLWSLWALRRHVLRRLEAERALQAAHAFSQAMGDSLKTGLRARDLTGRIIYVNPAFCSMVGWTADELTGRSPPMPYWVDEDIDNTRALHDRILAGEGPSKGFEIQLKRRNGEIFPALIHEAPLIDANGRHTGWMSSVIDISEQKRADELAQQQQERLQATARLVTMGEMASSLAHELNQPLAAITSYNAGCLNQLASQSADIDGIRQALAKSMEQAQRAGRIIRRIYEFVRRSEPKTEPCDVARLIDETLTLIEGEMRRKDIRLIREVSRNLPEIDGDHVLLVQALLNLVRNAIDALEAVPPGNRRIAVSAHERTDHVEITIADTGPGISSSVAEHLFEPLFTTKPEGMGMGLNICRSVIEAHQGRLWYEPSGDGGSIFHVSLAARCR